MLFRKNLKEKKIRKSEMEPSWKYSAGFQPACPLGSTECAVRLSQLLNQYWTFSLRAVVHLRAHLVGLGKCVMTGVHHGSNTRKSLTALEMPSSCYSAKQRRVSYDQCMISHVFSARSVTWKEKKKNPSSLDRQPSPQATVPAISRERLILKEHQHNFAGPWDLACSDKF